jgi:hypothetical protein
MTYLSFHQPGNTVVFQTNMLSEEPNGPWLEAYDRFVGGHTSPIPHHTESLEDPARVQAMIEAYRAFVDGEIAWEDLPDIRDVLDPSKLVDVGIRTDPQLDARSLLVMACSQCHDATATAGTVRKSRFQIEQLDALSSEQKSAIAKRLQLPAHDPLRMPPVRFRDLSDEEVDKVLQYLKK